MIKHVLTIDLHSTVRSLRAQKLPICDSAIRPRLLPGLSGLFATLQSPTLFPTYSMPRMPISSPRSALSMAPLQPWGWLADTSSFQSSPDAHWRSWKICGSGASLRASLLVRIEIGLKKDCPSLVNVSSELTDERRLGIRPHRKYRSQGHRDGG